MTAVTLFLTLLVGLALGGLLGVLWSRSRTPYVAGLVDQAEVMQGLDRLSDQMRDLDRHRATWQGEFHQQVTDLARETRSLSTALRKPQVRGRWGELHLRRAVELAGLVDRCDFTEQVRFDDGAQRPDLVVHLVGRRQVVVDAKVPLDAYLDATSTDDDAEREHHLARHARQLRQHVDGLSSKAYWRALPETPEFVVLFVPGESFLSAALEKEPTLIEYAAERRVVLATPTTLIALLHSVAFGWRQESLARSAADIAELGRELYERLSKFDDHIAGIGDHLEKAMKFYNNAVGTLESRVLVSARRFKDLGVSTTGELAVLEPLESPIRALRSPELTDGVT